MILKSICLSNFQCYFGEVRFEFTEGLNLVIGDNGAGKSKLYDGFYWVLYDRVFDSMTREFQLTSHKDIRGNLVSDKAKSQCEIGESIKAEVEIVVYNPQREDEYILTRTYTITKLENGTWREPLESMQSALKKEKYLNARPVPQADIESIRRRILPDDVKPYMWFQGEQVDSLIDFKRNDTLTQAINVLSDISEFDFYEEVSQKAFETAEKDFQRESRRVSSNSNRNDELVETIDRLRRERDRLEAERAIAADELTKATEKKDDLLGNMDDARRIKELSAKSNELKSRLSETDERLTKMKAAINKNLFTRKWVLKGAGFLVDKYAAKYDDYTRVRMQKEAANEAQKQAMDEILKSFRLPVDVPEPIFIQQMLKKERCLVCDREAPIGTDAYAKIKELLDRSQTHKQKNKPESVTKNDFSNEFKSLYQNGLQLQGTINQVDYEIKSTLGEILEIEAKYKEIRADLDTNEKELMDVVNVSQISSVESSLDVVTEFQSHDNAIIKYVKDLERTKLRIEDKSVEIKKAEDELRSLATGKVPKFMEEKVEVLADFRDIAKSTRARVFNRLIEQLESEANKHFKNMTAENNSVRGRIKLERQANGNYMPKNLDQDGRSLSSINDSNIILIKLSVIMAIISAKRSSPAAELYPLISDAPTSKFGDNYAVGFCRAASEVYSQSIVISKDFYKNPELQNRLFEAVGDKLGNVYIIEPSLSEENQRGHRNELEVRATKIR
jgi:DNA sulfur modification protein DndD